MAAIGFTPVPFGFPAPTGGRALHGGNGNLTFVSPNGTSQPHSASSYQIGTGATSEVRYGILARIPGTFSNLAVRANAVGTSRVVRFRKNIANGNMVLTPADAAGYYTDGGNTDDIATGDVFNLAFTSSGSDPTYWYLRTNFRGATTHAAYYSSVGVQANNYTTASTTIYLAIAGRELSAVTTEANSKLRCRSAGTLKNAQCYVATNTNAADVTVRSRKNGANGNILITVGAGLTGRFEDTTNSDSLASGDDWNFSLTTGAGAVGFIMNGPYCAIDYGSSSKTNDIFARFVGQTRAASGSATFYPILGRLNQASATEADLHLRHGFPVRMSRMRLYLSANTYSAAATVRLRKNSADGNQTISIGAGLTGLFEDASNTDDCTADDDVCWSIINGTSGSITIENSGFTETDLTVDNNSYVPAQANLVLSTVAPDRVTNEKRDPASGNLALSTFAPSVVVNVTRNPAQANLALSTVAPSRVEDFAKAPAQGNLALSSVAPDRLTRMFRDPAQGNLSLSTVAPTQVSDLNRTPAQANLALSTVAPSLIVDVRRDPAQGNLALSTVAPSRVTDERRDPAQGNLVLSTFAASLVQTTNASLSPGQANLLLSTFAATLAQTAHVSFSPATANLVLSTVAPARLTDERRDPAQGNLTLSTVAPDRLTRVFRDPAQGNLALSTFAPTAARTDHHIPSPAQGNLTLSTVAPDAAHRQYMRPDADDTDGTWTNELGGTTLFSSIDEGDADDADYIQSASVPVNDLCKISLGNPGVNLSDPVEVQYRYWKVGAAQVDLRVRLLQGASEIASWTHTAISTGALTATQTLSAGELAAITDANDLYIEFRANAP